MKKLLFLLALFTILIAGIYFFKQQKAEEIPLSKNTAATCKDCNVVLISVDSLRADHISAYGYNRNTTPNFDNFAKNGSLFLNYFSVSFLTPVSEGAVQTGMYPTSNNVTNFDTHLSKNVKTISQYLKPDGYKTHAILSSPEFEANKALKESFSRGFNKYEYVNFAQNNGGFSREYPSTEILNSHFDSFGKNKFFLWLPVGGAHWPYGANAKNIFADPNYNGFFENKTLDWNQFQYIYNGVIYPEKTKLQQEDIQYVLDQYDNGVKSFDDFFAEIINQLKNRNLLDSTIIIVESEHGEDLGEHGYFAHYDVLDTQTHVPLFIYIPQIKKKQKISSFAGSVDVLPTILETLGKNVSENIQGKSLLPILTGKEKDKSRQQVFMERNPLWEEAHLGIRKSLEDKGIKVTSGIHKDIAIRTPEWKYIIRLSSERLSQISWWQNITGQNLEFPKTELYDLRNDPQEKRNVADKHPQIEKELKAKLDDWYSKLSTNTAKPQVKEEIQPYF